MRRPPKPVRDIFHGVEKSFPLRGKTAETFSIAWNNPPAGFASRRPEVWSR
jgi:hypothetical protein